VPQGHWKTTTFIAALRHDGLTAPCVFDGAINGVRFLAYVKQALAPTLRAGDVVVLDNLKAHKVKGVREAIAATGARLLYLPPYSPDFQPDRAGLRQAQGPAPHRRKAHRRRPVAGHRPRPRRLHPRRMHQLLR
jgi:hypothetical protein